MRRLSVIIMLLGIRLCAFAQHEVVADSVITDSGLSQSDLDELTKPIGKFEPIDTKESLIPESMVLKPEIKLDDLLEAPEAKELPTSLVITKQDIYGKYPLPAWQGGYVYGSSYSQASMLYGYMSAANAGIRHRFSHSLTANAEIGLQKHSVYYNTATMSGQVIWQPSPYFALTAFGAYSPGSFMSPVNIGPSFQWGGYITLQTDTSVPFGIDLGARQTYDAVFGHELVPIVQPFVKFGDAKIGIDIGPLLKEATRKQRGDNGGFNPIPQPIKAIPQVAPRR